MDLVWKKPDAEWDSFLEQCSNARLYARAFSLNALSKQWIILQSRDGLYRMPVPYHTKYLVPIAYTPFFCQQLGVFSALPITSDILIQFMQAVKTRFFRATIHFNAQNPIPTEWSNQIRFRQNYILPLQEDWPTLEQRFSSHCKRMLRKTAKDVCVDVSSELVLQQCKQHLPQVWNSLPAHSLQGIETSMKHFPCICLGMRDDSGIITASAAFSMYKNRITYILGSSMPDKKRPQMHGIFAHLIRQYAGTQTILDFEGSDIPGIARFYEGFGAINEPYAVIQWKKWM